MQDVLSKRDVLKTQKNQSVASALDQKSSFWSQPSNHVTEAADHKSP
jgi:hypothetical protein